jgi:hypothetical protein
LGIGLALIILKLGFSAGWFGRAESDEDIADLSSTQRGWSDRSSFTTLSPPPAPRRKHAAPSAKVVQKLRAEIDATFSGQLSGELPDEQKRDLARQIVKLADDARDLPDDRFCLLLKAGELAAESGDLVGMDSVVATLDGEYEIETSQLIERWLHRFAEVADEPQEIEILVAHARLAIDRAVAEDRYDDALALADASVAACRRPAGEKQRHYVEQGRERIARLRNGWPEYQEARRKLQTAPDDPEANFTVGRWLCLERDAWSSGLLYLAKGGEHPLAEAARLDRAVASASVQPEKSLEIADRWYDLAMADEADRGCLGRAFHWYRSAQGMLAGEDATHVEQRLAAIFQEAALRGMIPAGADAFGSSRPSN